MSHTEAATSMSQEEAWKLIKKQAKEIADLRKRLEMAYICLDLGIVTLSQVRAIYAIAAEADK